MLNVSFWVLLLCLIPASTRAAEQFGDISVSPQPFASGDTYHGYGELRVVLENRSPKETHRVTLIFPDHSYGAGNCISRVSRTVSLGPNSQVSVPLWQPPLPANGSGLMRVEVDGEAPGTVRVSERHAAARGYGSDSPATMLISRSINFEDATHKFQGQREAYTAKMATGAPDATARHGFAENAWTPDRSSAGPHWLELEYATPMKADTVRIYETEYFYSGQIILMGVSGTNLAVIPITPISGPHGRTGPLAGGREFSFPMTVEPVKTVRLEFSPMPASSISIDAVQLAGGTNSGWAASAKASSDGAAAATRSLPGGAEARALLRAEMPVGQWSENWISYTPYDAIVLSGSDLSAAPPAVATALWRYAECGGQLVIFGTTAVPEPWRSLKNNSLDGGRSFSVGFGQCFVFEKENLTTLNPAAVKVVTDAIGESERYWQTLPDDNGANATMPVIENARVPVRGTLLVMLGFVVVIGPVNLIVLSRMKRRIWMLWTIPAISLATCFFVFAYSLLREGITPTFRLQGITLLDQANHRASSYGAMAFYCPLTPSSGLNFNYDTEVTPLVRGLDYSPFSSGGASRELDWTQSQHLQRGWITARVPAQFHLRKSETRRERLEMEKSGGELNVVNGLGAAISRLWLADETGKIYFSVNNVAAGQKTKLSPFAEYPQVNAQFGPKALFKEIGYTAQSRSDSTNTAAFLKPGTYIAELDENPFLEKSLAGKTKRATGQSRSVVYGILETSPGL